MKDINGILKEFNIDKIDFIKKCTEIFNSDDLFKSNVYKIDNINIDIISLTEICNCFIDYDNLELPPIIPFKGEYFSKNPVYLTNDSIKFEKIRKITEIFSYRSNFENNFVVAILCESFYKFCKKHDWNDKKIKKIVNYINLSNISELKDNYDINEIILASSYNYYDILKIGEIYANEVLRINRSKGVRNLVEDEYYKVIEHVDKLENNDDIVNYLLNLKYSKTKLNKFSKGNIYGLKQLLDCNIDSVISKFEVAIPKVIELQIENEKKTISLVMNYLELYVNSDYSTLQKFCLEHKFNESLIKKYLIKIRRINPKLYNEVLKKFDSESKFKNDTLKTQLYHLIDFIKKGIEDNEGNVRKFELLDYYLNFNISFDELEKVLIKSKLKYQDLHALRKFVVHYRTLIEISEKSIFDEKISFCIDDQTYTVTPQDKINTIKYLKDNKIPLYYPNYHAAVKRLVFEKIKK